MIQITPHHRLLMAVNPIDFRKGIDGLKSICELKLSCNPFTGTLFAFTNRAQTSVKLLIYDANGFWLCQKRFSQGKLNWWPKNNSEIVTIRASELQILLAQGNPMKADLPKDWKSLIYAAEDKHAVFS